MVAHICYPSFKGGLQSKSIPTKKGRPYMKNNKQKGMGMWLKRQNACLAGARPWIQTLVLPKEKKKGNTITVFQLFAGIFKSEIWVKPQLP
jgi:hypothetical protein